MSAKTNSSCFDSSSAHLAGVLQITNSSREPSKVSPSADYNLAQNNDNETNSRSTDYRKLHRSGRSCACNVDVLCGSARRSPFFLYFIATSTSPMGAMSC